MKGVISIRDFTNLKDFMDRLTSWIIPGNSIAVYYKHERVFSYSSGFADLENRRQMQGDELFNIYSCSKVATVTAALQLYEKGFFLLDDPVSEFIPEYRRIPVQLGKGRLKEADSPITMRHLFTMTAGLSYNLDSFGIEDVRKKTNGRMPTVEVAKGIAKEPLLFEPGEKWNYSLCHDVLAAVVEVISGERFSDYVKHHIFEPIGVQDIYYHRDDGIRSRMAEQYQFVNADDRSFVEQQIQSSGTNGYLKHIHKEAEHVLGPEYDSGGAGIVVSVPDYAIFASALANGGIAPNGERILSPGTIELLRTNQLNEEQKKQFNWSQLKGYGYGLGVRTLQDRALSGFNGASGEFGWGGAAGATLLADPDTGLAYFYSHHMLNPQEDYYQPRLRNVVYSCMR